MFSFKPLALYALLAFGVLSSSAIPVQKESNASALPVAVDVLRSDLAAPLENMKSLPAGHLNVQTLTPIFESMHKSFGVATHSVQSSDCGCSGGNSSGGLEETVNALGELLHEVLDVVDEVLSIVGGLVNDLEPLLANLGNDLDSLVSSVVNVVDAAVFDVVGILNSLLSGNSNTINTISPSLAVKLDL